MRRVNHEEESQQQTPVQPRLRAIAEGESPWKLHSLALSPRERAIAAMPPSWNRFLIELFDSRAFLALVLLLVSAHAALLLHGEESTEFETFCSLFFAAEVAVRIFAHRPARFFRGYSNTCFDLDRWTNCADFVLSVLDLISLLLMYQLIPSLLPSNAKTKAAQEEARVGGHMAGRLSHLGRMVAKSGRFTESLFRLVRIVRLWRVLKGARPLVRLAWQCIASCWQHVQGDGSHRLCCEGSCLFDWCDWFEMDLGGEYGAAQRKRMEIAV